LHHPPLPLLSLNVMFPPLSLSPISKHVPFLRVEDPTVPTFAVSLVENTGDFASSWWWYFGIEEAQVSGFLSQNRARLISIDPYQTSAGLRFAVVMVPNVGVHNKAWWWYYGVDGPKISSLVNENNARLVALRPYLEGGKRLFAVIMISNTGADARNWEWCYGQTTDTINSLVTPGKLRITALVKDPASALGYDAILVERRNEGWYWWFGQTPAQILSNIVSHKTRLIDSSTYFVSGSRRYTAVELDNPQGPQVSEI
jgi:hypothetical protein